MNIIKFNIYLHKMKHDKAVFKEMYEYCCDVLTRRIEYRYGKIDYVTDAVHEIIEYILYKYTPRKYVIAPVCWLKRIADNKMLRYVRQKESAPLPLIDNIVCAPHFEDEIDVIGQEFKAMWQKLDPVTRDIIILNALKGYSLKEIAQMFDMNYNTVRQRYSRAVHLLKKCEK